MTADPSNCTYVEGLLERPNSEWFASTDPMQAEVQRKKTSVWYKDVARSWEHDAVTIPSQHGNHTIIIEVHRWRKATSRRPKGRLVPVLWCVPCPARSVRTIPPPARAVL